MKKVIICLFTFALVMTGCVSTTAKKTNSESKVIEIGVDDAIAKIQKKQSFVLLVTRKQCEYCEAMLEMLKDTINDHNLVIYDTIMRDDTVEHLNEDVDKLKAYLDRPDQTPHYYYIKNGEVADAQKGYTQFQPDRFWEWVAKNDLEGMK